MQLPLALAFNATFIIPVYFLCGFPVDASYFFYFFFVLYLTNMTAFYQAMLLAASIGNSQIAFSVFPLVFLFLSLFSGFMINVGGVPDIWKWAPYVSYARWVFEGLMVNHWSRYVIEGQQSQSEGSHLTDGIAVLNNYDFNNFHQNNSFWIVAVNIVGFTLLTYYAMRPPKSRLLKAKSDSIFQTVIAVGEEEGLGRGRLVVNAFNNEAKAPRGGEAAQPTAGAAAASELNKLGGKESETSMGVEKKLHEQVAGKLLKLVTTGLHLMIVFAVYSSLGCGGYYSGRHWGD